jgi:dTDP-glucose 4,6-dehydratase
LASTSETYGDPKVHPQPETYWGNVNPVGVRSVYDEAKRYAEALTMALRREYGVDTAIARIFNTYGPRMRTNDGRAIPTFVTQALMWQPLTVAGDGSQTRSVCYVDDLVEGVVRLLRSNLPGPLNVGNPHEQTILETSHVVRTLCRANVDIAFMAHPQDDPNIRCPDITQARERLDWEPRVDLLTGLRKTIEWFADELRVYYHRPYLGDHELGETSTRSA